MQFPQSISYSLIIGDLFHFGHLKMFENAKKHSDYHICGVISDEIVKKWAPPLICSYEERKEVIAKIKYVDEVILQDSLDPTDNLKNIHERFPEAKILLIQNHILGGSSILGIEYIKQIKGEVIPHEFYSNLSREYIKKLFIKDFVQNRDIKQISFNDIKIGDIDYFQKHFSTKANTIQSLSHILKNAVIEKEFIFTVEQWEKEESAIIKSIANTFKNTRIVIRSSSFNEDSIDFSNAGHFESVLNVNSYNEFEIKSAVIKVINSYYKAGNFLPENQLLVQKQTLGVIVSGVVFTRNLLSNTPYYLINYDDKTAETNTVTGGLTSTKVEILKDLPIEKINTKWFNLISAVKEIETFFKNLTLDIEFAINSSGNIVIFQVRPLAANTRFYSFDDEIIKRKIFNQQQQYVKFCNYLRKNSPIQTIEYYLSDMAFWNPAELIGDRPNYLDYSLFCHLIMKSNWNEAIAPLGFTKVNDSLLVLIGNKPYINVHYAFLSLLPQSLNSELKKKLLNFYNLKLKNNPELHDKVEFEIVHNCYRFDFIEKAKELLDDSFTSDEVYELKLSLINLTNQILNNYKLINQKDNEDIRWLEKKLNAIKKKSSKELNWKEKIYLICQLIEDCKINGTIQFSRVARMAFIGSSLIRSVRDISLITSKELDEFMNSIVTIATTIDDDFTKVLNKKIELDEFIAKYGHLRPGTYDITKLPYSKNISYILNDTSTYKISNNHENSSKKINSNIDDKLSVIFDEICPKHGIKVNGREVIDFIKKSIQLREYIKFIYSKNISLAIELIAEVGEEFGFTRDELSNLDYYTIYGSKELCSKEETINIWSNLIAGRIEEKRINSQISLPSIIFSEQDFVIVPSYLTKPNFITDAIIDGDIILIDKAENNININNKIVVIEKADPGYDWIFTKKIKALITKFGGVASHMAIRCAEFNIPAAIGCGDLIFTRIISSNKIILDCKNKIIHTL